MTPRGLLAALALFSYAFPACSATIESTLDEVAQAIENNYYDAAKARQIAEQLRADAKAGTYAAANEPRVLAAQLTARLAPIDRHFKVLWSPSESKSESNKSSASLPQLSPEVMERRTGYGFRRVEILPGNIGYIDMRGFADFSFDNPDEPARKAADAALQLVSNADAVIIDLRDNGGGSPAMVGYLVSAFTKPDANIYNEFHGREGAESERPKLLYAKPMLDTPLYVLISGRTGSAAEAAAYTLQAAKRAVILGESSAGAANPGGYFPLDHGFSVFVSTGSPINAVTGTNWEGSGVKPEIAVPSEQALERAQLLALEVITALHPNRAETADARWALEAARAAKSPRQGAALSDYVGTYGDATLAIRNGKLQFKRGRRPSWTLMRLNGDTFFAQGEPSRRLHFERDSSGKVSGFELQSSFGFSSWYAR
jgi:Peptidase family S41/N-terminal domain of Peptidase_S41 in eukaryotic IRBP